jgi:hypothetical protein
MMEGNFMEHLEEDYAMDLVNTILQMAIFMKECGLIIRDMEREYIITQMEKSIAEIIILVKEMGLVYSTTRMEIDMKVNGEMEI